MALIEKLTNIADAIREKTGGTEKLSLDGMAEAIAGISAGGGGEQSVLNSLIDGSITEITSNATAVKLYACYNLAVLKSATFPLATSIGNYSFHSCHNLADIDFPLSTKVGENAFHSCYALTSVDFPLVTVIGKNAFYGCYNLTSADFSSYTTISSNSFYGCYSLKAVVLRFDRICILTHTNAFNNCYHFFGTVNATYNPDGLKDGYFYVPRKWLSDDDEAKDYRRATNWSYYATQFRALEDYTVDGTTTGALDLTKI